MFNSNKKFNESLKSYKFDLNLVINDKAPTSNRLESSQMTKKNNYSEICEKSILKKESKIQNLQIIIYSCIDSVWKNNGKWKKFIFTATCR